MLSPTGKMVARNSNRSDFSFLPMPIKPNATSSDNLPEIELRSPMPAPPKPRGAPGEGVSGQQSSVGVGQRHQLPRPGQPGFPAANPPPPQPTDDSSPLTCDSHHF